MRKIILFYIVYLFVCIIILLIPTSVDTSKSYVETNHIVKTVQDNWKEIQEGRFKKIENVKSNFLVVGNDNNVLLKSSDTFKLDTNIHSHIKNKDTIIEMVKNNVVVGKVVIENNDKMIYQNKYRQVKVFCSIAMIIAGIMMSIFMFVLWKTLLKPINKIKKNVEHIAQGNLEMPLIVECKGVIGDFADSFNILRESLLISKNEEILLKKKNKEIIASLSHDIKTPVASIKAVAELLSVQEEDDIKRNKLSSVIMKAEQINLLADNLLQTTLEELNEWEVSVNEEASEIISNIIKNADYKNYVLPFSIEPCLIRLDKNKAVQVFDNIINNSYKYADTPIEINTRCVDKYLEISIADFGDSISDEDIELITQKFYRGKNSEGYIGTGLGLYISKSLIKKMGGELFAKKEADKFCIKVYILLV